MNVVEAKNLRYPIGEFIVPESISQNEIDSYMEIISSFPEKLKSVVSELSADKLNTHYREGGWTVKQVVHHLADSHMNAFIRFKLALTEDIPTVKPYFEDRWAELEDGNSDDINLSLTLLEVLHKKWHVLMKSMSEEDFEKSFFHPEYGREFKLKEITAQYSWHCEHHFAHIIELLKRKGW
ncbi:MAG: putative metal-dependent hydrolase YfiT [Ignavibacteria bacterium]|nr:putative metal-dependent hydrolase YfiT [Ignavibacteria bacterium]